MHRNSKRKTIIIVILASIVVGCVGVISGFFAVKKVVSEQFGPPDPNLSLVQEWIYPLELFVRRKTLTLPNELTGEEHDFKITQGESVAMICLRLEQMGLIDDAELMRTYLVYSGLDRQLKSGQFKLNTSMSPIQISIEFLDASLREAIVTILPGWRIEEVAVNVAGSGLDITAEDFINAATNPTPAQLAQLPASELSSLEGFLFPGSYTFPKETGLETVLDIILSAFNQQMESVLVEGFTRQGLSIQEAVILASIVEKEAVVNDEKPLIASVFYNRLGVEMRLETDPTIQYALGYQPSTQSWWKSPLSINDLSYDSPYNTYINRGLTPTPICNPGLESLRAVAYPAETPYFYFRATCDGSGRHSFAITFEEHLNNSCD